MRWRPLAEWIGFQLVWLICAVGASKGYTAPGVLAASVFVGAVLAMKRWSPSECLVIITSGIAGLIVESGLVLTEVIRFATPWPSPYFVPAWIIALWVAFGATLSTLASWIGHRFIIAKAGIIGFIAGPLAYWAGERLSALEIVGSVPRTYLAIALIWAVALPILLICRRRLAASAYTLG